MPRTVRRALLAKVTFGALRARGEVANACAYLVSDFSAYGLGKEE